MIRVDGDLERAIKRLRKISYPELAAIRLREIYPKRSEFRRIKKRKAERRRLKAMEQTKKKRERYWARRKRQTR